MSFKSRTGAGKLRMKRLTLLLKPAQRKTDNVIIEAGLLLPQSTHLLSRYGIICILIRLLLIDYRGIE